MKAKILDDKVKVYGEMDLNATLLTELAVGNEVEIGKSTKKKGAQWAEVTLPDGQQGYIRGDTRIFQVRKVSLLQKTADLYEQPSKQSSVKKSYNKGQEFFITEVVKEGKKDWVKICDLSGNEGFMEGNVRIKTVDKEGEGALFKESAYLPFMLSVFISGGLLVIPLTWGLWVGLGYFAALPWSLASCVVFLIAFRRNGTISWGRAIPAIIAILIAAQVYATTTGKGAFAAGGFLGFLAIMTCGYIGIGIARLFKYVMKKG